MVITHAFRMRIYPDRAQSQKIDITLHHCRFVYNHMLYRNKTIYARRKEHLSYYEMQNLLPKMKKYLPWLKEADSQALKYVCRQVNNAYDKFFKKQSKFPKFKSKHNPLQSYTTTNISRIIYLPKEIILPCLGKMRCSDKRVMPENSKICYATISKENGKYYCSITFKYEKAVDPVTVNENQVIGLDYKSDGLYVDSNGYSPKPNHFYRDSQKKLKKLQRALSKKKGSRIGEKKSNRWYKQHEKVCKLQSHVANQRKDYLHKQSCKLAGEFNAVCVEDLNMKAISNSDFGNGKATLDNGYGMFLNFLDYKLKEKGKYLVKVDRFYPSSQICHCCGHVNRDVKDLRVRDWICPECGTKHNRDINAAINLKNEGMRILGLA